MERTPLFAVACVFALGVSTLVFKRLYGLALCVVIAGACGLSLGSVTASFQRSHAETMTRLPMSDLSFSVIQDPSPSVTGHKAKLSVSHGGKRLGVVDARFSDKAEIPRYGERLSLSGTFKPYGTEGFERKRLQEGVLGSISVWWVHSLGFEGGFKGTIERKRAHLLSLLDPSQGADKALVAGVVAGSGGWLQSFGVRESFAQTGLSHMVAVSGSHLAVVTALIAFLLKKARMRPLPRAFVVLFVTFCYVIFTALQPSALRSWIMCLCLVLSPLAKRRSSSLSALSVAGIVMLALNPSNAFSLSFTLSVVSVLALIAFSAYVTYLLETLCPFSLGRRGRPLVQMLSLTLCAQIATMPFTIPVFNIFSLISPLANLVVNPLVSALLVMGLVGGLLAMVVPATAGFAFMPALACARLTNVVAGFLAGLPFSFVELSFSGLALSVGVAALVCFVWIRWPLGFSAPKKRVLAVAAMALLVFVGWRLYATPQGLYALDVGQGDAILVRGKHSRLLIDVGDKQPIKAALLRHGIRHLDGVLFTHLDKDHIGGVDALSKVATIDTAYVAKGVADNIPQETWRALEQAGTRRIVELSFGDSIRVDTFHMSVIWPFDAVDGNDNNDSLCLWLQNDAPGTRHDFSAFLTGDAEQDTNEALFDRGLIGKVDVLKVGHHGARVSLTKEQALRLAPRYALISCGRKNSYGHPHRDCLEALGAAGSRVLRTDTMGDVGIVMRPWGLVTYGE